MFVLRSITSTPIAQSPRQPVDPERPSYRDLWPSDQLHSRGIVATREHAERARIKAGMYVLEIGCGLFIDVRWAD